MTRKRRLMIAAACALAAVYFGGLVLGYRRLPWAAIRNLADHELVTAATVVTIDREQTSISPSQEQYLKHRLPESPVPTTPRIHVQVTWNALVCARVKAGHYVGPTGAESKDTLFVNLFGAWMPVYTFSHLMA
jgi:hypothetical protein